MLKAKKMVISWYNVFPGDCVSKYRWVGGQTICFVAILMLSFVAKPGWVWHLEFQSGLLFSSPPSIHAKCSQILDIGDYCHIHPGDNDDPDDFGDHDHHQHRGDESAKADQEHPSPQHNLSFRHL